MATPAGLASKLPGAKPRRTYDLHSSPEQLFSRDGPLGSRADVKIITSDGQILWLHRVVLEMWSSLFQDLIAASEEHLDAVGMAAEEVSITVTDTAADLMLLLSCLYPAAHSPGRQGYSLDAGTLPPLLGLADKYHCRHIIDRCAAFAVDHLLPRLAACSSPALAADFLQLRPASEAPQRTHDDDGAAGGALEVVDWVVHCLELGVRLELEELVEGTAGLLGQRFFEWQLQADGHRELLTRVTRVLPPEQFVKLVLQAIPPPSPSSATGKGDAPAPRTVIATRGARMAARRSQGGVVAGGAGGGGGAAGGGPRIVPVVVAAAGPAAAVAQQGGAPLPLAAAAPVPGQPQLQAMAPQPFMDVHQNGNHQQQHFAGNAFWPGAFPMPENAGAGVLAHPEPFLGPGGAGW